MIRSIKNRLNEIARQKLELALSLVNEKSQPNLNQLHLAVRNITLTNMNIKAMGYDLAQRLAYALPVPSGTTARHVGLRSSASVQADIESDWVAHWCGQLRIPVIFHRKIWELGYVLQAMFENGQIREGARGLGFGCGTEAIPSYLASRGVATLVTDLASDAAQSIGWAATNQHASSLEQAYHPGIVDRETFDRLVHHRYVDMNAIPADLVDFDFCWSVCALEHLGSIAQGLDFIEAALGTLRPGGLAVHTTELNINPEGPTIDNWATVLFQRQHFEAIAARLEAQGHSVAPLDFSLGDKPMDRFIDLPPWSPELPKPVGDLLGQPNHLKVSIDGFASTCFGLVIRKAGDDAAAPTPPAAG